jgi:FMN-binding domain
VTRAALVLACLLALPARGDELFLSDAQAPVALFGPGSEGERQTLQLSDPELHALSRAVGRSIEKRDYPYLLIRTAADGGKGDLRGVIFLLQVVGQTLPIDFAVGVRPDRTLQDLQVMVYREPYGKEINQARFRAQFRGRNLGEPLTVNKDIAAVSGATISSTSAAYAARKGLGLAQILWQRAGQIP